MDLPLLTWINTLALLAAAVSSWREMRRITASLERMATSMQRIEETAARTEDLTRSVRLRLAHEKPDRTSR